ncbi:MAG TPA: Gfo/Idh/MocA family oxidoreductase, partial [Phycisphaerae bacterium]|nr:Gfo/Idh/MocA family oxidoreductase [Phycisphaerae bacterium]
MLFYRIPGTSTCPFTARKIPFARRVNPRSRSLTMASTVRWGILSTANIAQGRVIPAINNSRNGRVVAIASRNGDRARKVAGQLGIDRAWPSYEDLLADGEVDAIYNPLPAGLLAEWSLKCARAGKPTLVEKPFATNVHDAREVFAAFAASNLAVAEAFMYRHHPLTKKVLDIVRSGRLGQLRSLRASFHAGQSDEADIRFSPELGGGAMLDLGCYCLSILHALAGRSPLGVKSIVHAGPAGVDEQIAGVLDFGDGLLGSF